MTAPVPKLAYSAAEAAEALGCSESSVRRLVREGVLPSVRLGSRLVLPVAALQARLADLAGSTPVASASTGAGPRGVEPDGVGSVPPTPATPVASTPRP